MKPPKEKKKKVERERERERERESPRTCTELAINSGILSW